MQRLLITGGSGFLGEELARQASAAGWNTSATYWSRRPELTGVDWHRLDIRDAAATERAWRELRPDVVIHTAYHQSGPELWPVTVEGTAHVLRATRAASARMIHLSSDALFDGELAPGQSYAETDNASPITPYGKAKAAAERVVERELPGALVVRTSLLYAGAQPGQHERFIFDVLSGRAEAAFFTDELRCPIAVTDLAAALLELATSERSGRLHVAGPAVLSRYAFARAIATAHGHDASPLRAGLSATSGVRRPRNCALDSRLAMSLLRTRLRPPDEVLQATSPQP